MHRGQLRVFLDPLVILLARCKLAGFGSAHVRCKVGERVEELLRAAFDHAGLVVGHRVDSGDPAL